MLNKNSFYHLYQFYGHKVLIHAILLIIATAITGLTQEVSAQENKNAETEKTVQPSDSTQVDTVQTENAFLSSKVDYSAVDSMMLDVEQQKAFLYGQAEVKFEKLVLKADYIEIDFKTNLVYAAGVPDSTGKLQGKPIFTEDGKDYYAEKMTYNFQSQKGKINSAFTQEGDGYVHGEHIKKADTNTFFIKGGKYTTCNLEHPHFHINANRLKVINQKKIITGPANLVIEDVQTPIAIPFGFFPNKNERQSGILIPAYGESKELGFNLTNGGYYWAISKNADLELRGDIYTNGSYALRAVSRYKKRYKFGGNFNLNYVNTKEGDRETVDYSETESFFVRWNHRMDSKARPNSSFTASVNAGKNNYFRNDFNTDINQFLTNQFKSNITYSQRIPNSPFNFSLNASHSQNSNESTISITLPQATFTMSRIFPMKKLTTGLNRNGVSGVVRDMGQQLGFSTTVDAKNQVTRKEEDLFTEETLDYLQNGIQTSVPISTGFKLGYLNISGEARYGSTTYFKTIRKEWDDEAREVFNSDTLNEVNTYFNQNYSASVSTNVYGMYTIKKGPIKAVRHTMTPSLSVSYTPDQSSENLGYYREVQSDTLGNTTDYSIFEGGVYGTPSSRKTEVYGFSLQNSIEMKVKTESDTGTAYKKVKLLEALNFNTGYDVHRDSLNWNTIRVDARTNIGKLITFQAGANLDPYAVIDSSGVRINRSEYDATGNWFRIPSANGSIGIRLKSKSTQGKDKADKKVARNNNENYRNQYNDIQNNPDAYVDFNIPWSFNMNYSVRYTKLYGQEEDYTLVNTLNFFGDVNLTENWKIGFRSGYDFEERELTTTSLQIFRNIHCWQINFNVIPFGTRTSYTFDIGIKAPILQDLKYNKRSNWFDNN